MEENGSFQEVSNENHFRNDIAQENGVQIGEIDGSRLEESTTTSSDSNSKHERETWGRSAEFILSCVGFAVGLGNIWRFPYLCYKNGGGAFLVVYLLFMLICGIPIFFLEIAVGQFMGISGVKVWNIAPILKGIGYATTVILFLLNCYYIVIMAWDGFYLADTFAHVNTQLPWATCGNSWNTKNCKTEWFTKLCTNVTLPNSTSSIEECSMISHKGSDSVSEYWNNRILQISTGIDDVGTIGWQLATSLLVFWVLCYFCVWKGVKWSGKIVYFTATFPYLVITVLLIRGVTLEGAEQGLTFYLKPDFSRLSDVRVWLDAGTQIFFSFALALGALTALGSYNKLHNNCHRQALLMALIDTATSFYAGLAIFSVLGYMAHEQGVSVEKVVDKGPGLAFIAYPKATATMPFIPHFWAILFFIMIIFVGLDSQFVAVESFITTVMDIFPRIKYRRFGREIVGAGYCIVSFLIGLTMVTNGGIYVFELFNNYAASGFSLLWVCFFECAAVAWFYGVGRFCDNLKLMIGFKPFVGFKICWLTITPLTTGFLFISMWVWFEPMAYGPNYTYPMAAQVLGVCMALLSMLCIPGYAIYALASANGTLKQRWKTAITPKLEERQLSVTRFFNCDTKDTQKEELARMLAKQNGV